MDLKGKIVFITGGAQGLGKAYTEALLEKGAKVFFGDVNPETGTSTAKELSERFGEGNIRYTTFDVTDQKGFEDAFAKAVSEFGHIDIMINNAGILNESLWEKMIQINLAAVVTGTKLATEHMRKDKGGRGGRIINISSIAGLNDFPTSPIYCATKHAVRSFTSSLALSPNIEALGIEYGILCPGPTATDLILKIDTTRAHFIEILQSRWETTLNDVPTIVAGFMKLVQLEKLNGAILLVQKVSSTFEKMEHHTVQH